MNRIYANSEEKYVKTVVLYGKNGNNYLHTDDSYAETSRIDKDTLMDLCMKGVKILYNKIYYTPLYFKDETTKTSVTFATNVASSASTSVTLYSKEHA